MEFLYSLIDQYNLPILSAFLLGIITSLSPCPLATNITAIAYISRDLKNPRNTLLNGLFYSLGRGISYTVLAFLIYFGLSAFSIAKIFQGWGDKILGIVLIFISLVMFDIVKLKFNFSVGKFEEVKNWFATKGYLGSLVLGMIFALAFCPYSGVIFFGLLIPLVLNSASSLFLPICFAFGTALPVILFAFLLALGFKKLNKVFRLVQGIEKWIRRGVASVFMITGLYYLHFLIEYLLLFFN
jgi:cytochrome c biogenesis protein CcdA